MSGGREERFTAAVDLPVPAGAAFAWHERPGAFERLRPPWEAVRVLSRSGGIEDGATVELEVRIGPIRSRWRVRHTGYVAGRQFVDVLERGPFRRYRHEHRFEPAGAGCRLVDDLAYQLPGGWLGRMAGGASVRRRLARTFRYRHAVTAADLAAAAARAGSAPMKVAIAGASGLVGRALVPFLSTQGHAVRRLVRPETGAAAGLGEEVPWSPGDVERTASAVAGVDALIHLGGVNLAEGRWTSGRRRAIRESRVQSTATLAASLAALPAERRPRVWICASAVGWYGDQPERVCAEPAPLGTGFLAEVCRDWEGATAAAEAVGVRVVHLRLGVVLSPEGGALARLLPIFRVGAGGPVGTGRQWLSWITLDDLVGAIGHVLSVEAVRGPVNAVAPAPVRQEEFAAVLGRVLGRPAGVRTPAFALRLAFGAMADEVLLAGVRAAPEVLLASGYRFRHNTLEEGLRHLLGTWPT